MIQLSMMKESLSVSIQVNAHRILLPVTRECQYTGLKQCHSLDPGLQYCVGVAAMTSAGIGEFMFTVIPCLSFSLFFFECHSHVT